METQTTESRTNRSTRTIGLSLVAAALVVVSVITMAGSVSAQSGPAANCRGASVTGFGSDYYGLGDFGNRLQSTSPVLRDYVLASPLEPGAYVLDAVSYDGYLGREQFDPQPQEQWYVQFLSADGTIVATSGVTGDLEDGVDEATWSGNLGEVTIDQTAVVVRIQHASPGSISVNSVRPVCLGATAIAVPDSTLVIDFNSTAATGSNVMVACGDLEESARGTMIDLLIEGLPAGSDCAVAYPEELICTVVVAPPSTEGSNSPGGVDIQIPDSGDTSILVNIDCAPIAIAGPTTTAPPTDVAGVVENAPTTTAPPTDVAGIVENAPTAQVQPGTPAFTG